MLTLFFVVAAYLLGSVSFAVVTSRVFGIADPRTYGSGNPGATNVLRSGKKLAAALTLLGDAAKGWIAVAVAMHFVSNDSPLLVALVFMAVFLGHLYPIFLGFQGGKGVATALGVLLALNLWLGLAALVTWLFFALVFRLSSLAALMAAISAPIYAYRMNLHPEWVIACTIMSLLLIWRHKRNIQNLLAGRESRIGKKTTP